MPRPSSTTTTTSDATDLPEDPDLPKGYFSHSQYSQFNTCGEAYFRKYVEGEKLPRYGSQVRGSAVDKAVELALKAKIAKTEFTLDAGLQTVSEYYEKLKDQDVRYDEDNPLEENRKQADDMVRVAFSQMIPALNPLRVQERFLKMFGGVPVLGFIDVIDAAPIPNLPPDLDPAEVSQLPSREVVRDLKTGKRTISEHDVDKHTQLTLYAAVSRTPFAGIEMLAPLKKGVKYTRRETHRTNQDIAVLEEHFSEVVSFIKDGRFPKATIDSWVCNKTYCAFWASCRGRKK